MENNKNDQRIITLKNEINKKKKDIGKIEVFAPITNCNLELNGTKHNIHVLSKENLLQIMIQLNAYRLSAENLGVLSEYEIRGYHVDDWIADIKSRLNNIKIKEETTKLIILENKLTELLSADKKVELELDEIESYLKS